MEFINVNVRMVILEHDVNIVSDGIDKIEYIFKYLVNGCASSPCQNDGQCVSDCSSTVCSIKCLCLNGTSGVYCEQKDNSCLKIN